MNQKHVPAALITVGLAVFAVVAHDASVLTHAIGIPIEDGEAGVAMTGFIVAVAAIASGLRGLRPARMRIANA